MSKKDFFYLIGICLLQVIVLTGQCLGLNVILFMIPLLAFLCFYLKENDLISHKKGFLLMIPIVILSCSYFIYDNVMKYFNVLAIPFITLIMLTEVIHPIHNLEDLLQETIYSIFMPIEYFTKHVKNTIEVIKELLPKNNKNLKVLKSILIVIPVVLIVLILLSSADLVFASIFKDIVKIFENISYEDIIVRIILFFCLFLYLGSLLYYIKTKKMEVPTNSKGIKLEEFTMKLLLTILNGIYIIFNGIQIFSLGFHKLPENITYAQYARTGFFQLMLISFINIAIILISKNTKESKYIKGMNLFMVLLTFLIIISSFYRMVLYEQVYGYTLLRVGVFLILFQEVILLIPTILYILKKDFPVFKYYLMLPIIAYSIVNMFSIEKIITNRNIALYNQKQKIDIEYLKNDNSDNIKELVEFYNRVEEEEIKNSLKYYLESFHGEIDNIFEYNISKDRANKIIKEELE